VTRSPADLSDDALCAAIALAAARRQHDGRLGSRTALAELLNEQARRLEVAELERIWEAS